MSDRINDLPAGPIGSPEHGRSSDQVPQWLEDAAHEQLVAATYARLHAAEDAAAAVDRIRTETARPHPELPAARPHPLRLFALRLETVLAVTVLLPVILLDHIHYGVTRRMTHRLMPLCVRCDDYLYRLETRLTGYGDDRFLDAVGLWISRPADRIDAHFTRLGYPR